MLGNRADTRAARRDATRRRILKAAWKLARRDGLAAITLRDLAEAVGMRAPSLYSYFDSKFALYDAMFADGNREFATLLDGLDHLPYDQMLREGARRMMAFCTADTARYQLLFQRTIPGFEPSEDSYAIAVRTFVAMADRFRDAGLGMRELDLWTCLNSGLASQQLANDPGGDRYVRLVDDAVDMFLQYVGITATKGKGRRR